MKLEPLNSGAVQIWMSNEELRTFGVDTSQLDETSPAARRALQKLLATIGERLPFSGENGWNVEAFPLTAGCLFIVTARRHRLFSMPRPRVFAIRDTDALLAFGGSLPLSVPLPAASLYGWGEEYRLIVYPEHWSWGDPLWGLSEFSENMGQGSDCAAYVEEHGVPITVGNALHRLRQARGSVPLTPSDPPR